MKYRTNIIQEYSYRQDCSLVQEIPIKFGDEPLLYNYMSATVRPLKYLRTLSLLKFNNTFDEWALDPIIFKSQVVYDWSLVTQHVTLNDIMGTLTQHHEVFESFGLTNNEISDEEVEKLAQNIVSKGYFGFLRGLPISGFQIWTFVCCAYVTLLFLGLHCVPAGLGTRSMLNFPQLIWRGFNAGRQRLRRFRTIPEAPEVPPTENAPMHQRRNRLRLPIRGFNRLMTNDNAMPTLPGDEDPTIPFLSSDQRQRSIIHQAIPMITYPNSEDSIRNIAMEPPGRTPYVLPSTIAHALPTRTQAAQATSAALVGLKKIQEIDLDD